MSFGEIFADAWNGASNAAKSAAGAIATGAKKVGEAAKWTAGKVKDGAQWAAGKVKDGAEWTADKAKQAAGWVKDTAIAVKDKVVEYAGIAKEVARNLGDIGSVAGRAFTEEFLGRPCKSCKKAEDARAEAGTNIAPDEAQAALSDAQLAQAVYGDQVPEGFTKVPADDPRFAGVPFSDPETGFQAAIYESPDGKAVLAFAGTQDGTDWKRNFQQGTGGVPDQYDQALQLAQTAKFHYSDDLSITGHSLGGGLATYAGLQTGTPTRAFNAAGLASGARANIGEEKLANNSALISNYNVIGEALSDGDLSQSPATIGINAAQVGEQHWVPSQPGGGPVNRHLMDNVIPSLEAAAGT